MKLKEGVYENIVNNQLKDDIIDSENNGLVCKTDAIDDAESSKLLAQYISDSLCRKLEDCDCSIEEKIVKVNALLDSIDAAEQEHISLPQLLSSVISKAKKAQMSITGKNVIRPLSGFRVSNLFTGGQSGLSLNSEITRDIQSADKIYIIVSFLRLSGVRMIIDKLRDFCSTNGHILRIITTTYCGITEPKALEQLSQLPNTEIRISYNSTVERLHAKSYIFLRNSGLSTAYIGSSNLSHTAHTDGLEWNIRVTNIENPHIIKSAVATFERYWNSDHFEDFRIGGIEKFYSELNIQRSRFNATDNTENLTRYQLFPHQKTILDRLQVERDVNNLYRNLIVAATGTGKTVISAFDYKRFCNNKAKRPTLLFVAHREEILKQSIRAYRSVLQDANFGDLWVGHFKPGSIEHIFVSVSTLHNNIDTLKQNGLDFYDYIVIDEAHHASASSYRTIVNDFKPKILLGLTATPERMDQVSLLPDFGNKISAEIRLPQALEEGLLTPFQYICVTDPVDISGDELWANGKYILEKLTDKLCNTERVGLIVRKLKEYISDETKCHALCFCSDKRHAIYMASQLRQYGLSAEALTSDTNAEERVRLNKALASGEINYLCVVDIFNEGVDIPEVDTALFLRPTDSLTIFLQQLGRGLRLSENKDFLTVLDFVAQVNRQYDFTSRFRALCTRQDKSIEEQVKNGFTLLPQGCSIYMEQKAKNYILDNIHSAIYNSRRLVKELMSYDTTPTLSQFVANNGQDIRLIYKNNSCWTVLKRNAGKCTNFENDEITSRLIKGMSNLIHINTLFYLLFIQKFLENHCVVTDDENEHYKIMLYYALYQDKIDKTSFTSVNEALATVEQYPLFKQEMSEIIDYIIENLEFKTYRLENGYPDELELYGNYTREEIFTIFNRQTAERRMQGSAAGLFYLQEYNTELLFVTLNKSDKDFSPTTQYNDYFISENRFHWQSQNNASHTNNGARYTEQKENGRRFILFVRESKRDAFGNTCPYYCMGQVDYISSYGNYPMNIEWQLQKPALPKFIKAV